MLDSWVYPISYQLPQPLVGHRYVTRFLAPAPAPAEDFYSNQLYHVSRTDASGVGLVNLSWITGVYDGPTSEVPNSSLPSWLGHYQVVPTFPANLPTDPSREPLPVDVGCSRLQHDIDEDEPASSNPLPSSSAPAAMPTLLGHVSSRLPDRNGGATPTGHGNTIGYNHRAYYPQHVKESSNQARRSGFNILTMSTNLNPRHVDGYPSLRRNGHGWVEYSLPGETPYYVHPGRQVSTDVNLRDGRLLKAVMAHLGDRNVAAPGRELWLRNTGEGEREWWVDHQRQLVTLPEASGEGDARYYAQRGNEEVNRLDAIYRYWSFMEVHPAHAPLPPGAQKEATDILTWASSALLLRLPRSASALFTRDECQEFITLLRSPDIESTFRHTRIVSEVLRRVARWRLHSCPYKPLPSDADPARALLQEHGGPLQQPTFNISPDATAPPHAYQPQIDGGGVRRAWLMFAMWICGLMMSAAIYLYVQTLV